MAGEVDPFDLNAGVPPIEGKLRPTPKTADRISKRVILLVGGGLLLIFGLMFMAISDMDNRKKQTTPALSDAQGKKKTALSEAETAVPTELKAAGTDDGGKGVSPASLVKAPETDQGGTDRDLKELGGRSGANGPAGGSGKRNLANVGQVPSMKGMGGGRQEGGLGLGRGEGNDLGDQGSSRAAAPLTPEQMAAKQAAAERLTRATESRRNGLSIRPFGGDKDKPELAAGANVLNNLLDAAKGFQQGGVMPTGLPVSQGKQGGDSEQDEKLSFLKNAKSSDNGYHPHTTQAALSPNEVKGGSFIKMTLEQNMNSDLPGGITARVTEDVYDSVTGCRLLIPAMTKALGSYDSKIAIGQGRNLFAWNRLYFANGDELNLGAMQGYDTSGAAGLAADVDNHYLRMFGLTLGMSIVTAGVQASVPQPPSGSTNAPPTVEQAVATALAQQYGQLGAQILGKYMAVQPTLKNFVGERFTIMVPNTIVFKKVWRNRCGPTS